MQRSEIIGLANALTERKGEKVLPLSTLFNFVCQDICKRQRFWWRRIQFSFQLVSGTPTYDLTQITTTPANLLNNLAIEEITKFTVLLTATPYLVAQFVPVFDPEALIDMLNNSNLTSPLTGNALNGQPGGRYTMDANDFKILRIDPPDFNYTATVVGWAMPNPPTDVADDTVPLIPPWGHNTIVAGMMAKIFRFAYGTSNQKTVDAAAEYEQGIHDLEMRKQFDPNYRSQLILSESAVRST